MPNKINIQIDAEIEMDDAVFEEFKASEEKDEFLDKRLQSGEGINILYHNVEHQVWSGD